MSLTDEQRAAAADQKKTERDRLVSEAREVVRSINKLDALGYSLEFVEFHYGTEEKEKETVFAITSGSAQFLLSIHANKEKISFASSSVLTNTNEQRPERPIPAPLEDIKSQLTSWINETMDETVRRHATNSRPLSAKIADAIRHPLKTLGL